ncbi:alpha/beta hydrolase fold domain-containing protein [Microbacterium sp. HJ5]
MHASDIELFYDEDRDYAQRLEAAGVEVTFETVADAPHCFGAWAPESEISPPVTRAMPTSPRRLLSAPDSAAR